MSKFKKGDRVIICANKNDGSLSGAYNMRLNGKIATVERCNILKTPEWVQVRIDGTNLLRGEGFPITFHEDELVIATDLAKAIYT